MTLKQKILIVDDKKENLTALRQVLSAVDAEVIEAVTGNQALAETLNHQFALMIFDVMMPEMDGYELAEYLRGDEKTRLIPIIFVTASFADDLHMFKGYEAGGIDYIIKPFDPNVLLGKVRIFLELDRHREELRRQRDVLELQVQERTRDLTHLNAVLRAIRNVNLIITKEDDRDRMIRRACENMTGTLSYPYAWIALIDQEKNVKSVSQSAADKKNSNALSEFFDQGELPECGRRALADRGIVVTHEITKECSGCPISDLHTGCGGFAVRLEFENTTYGVVGVSVPVRYLNDLEEQKLFLEMATDISFAVRKIELADRHRILEHRNAQYARIVANAQDGMALIDRDYTYLEVNPAYTKLMEREASELVGNHLPEVLGEDFFVQKVKPHIDRCFSNEIERFETTRKISGTERTISVLYSPCPSANGSISAVAVNIRDITAHKLAEERERHLNAVLRSIRDVNQLIVREKHRQTLIEAVCDNLIASRGFDGVWIVLTDRLPDHLETAQSGFDDESSKSFSDQVRNGVLPHCFSFADAENRVVTFDNRSLSCRDCPIVSQTNGKADMVASIGYNSHRYGFIVVRLATMYAENLEESDLLAEIAGDIGFAFHGLDIEKERNKSRQTLSTIFDSAGDGILLADIPSNQFAKANKAVCNMLGYSEDEMLNLFVDDIHPAESLDYVRDQFERQLKGEISLAEGIPVKRKDGTVFPADVSSAPLELDGRPHLLGIFRDITERKKAEAEILNSKQKFHSMVDNIGIGVSLISSEMKILELNKQMREWFPDVDVLKRPICYQAFYNPPQNGVCEYCPTVKTFQDGRVHEVTIVSSRKGDARNYRIVSSPIIDELGRVTTAIELVDDITERLKLEKQLRQSQKFESIGTLAGGIAHDFNNILSSIIGFTELACDETEKGSIMEDNLQEIYSAGKRAKELVKQILTFARQTEEEMKPIRVDIIAREVVKFLRAAIPADIKIEQNISSNSYIMGNPIQVHQVLMNLCTNAASAMEKNGGRMTVSLKDIVIDGNSRRNDPELEPGGYIEISVADTGVGIPRNIIGSIFEPYFTTKPTGEGTGLGLSVVYGIVQSHGGVITVDSEAGKGTVFTVYLPVTGKRETDAPYKTEELPLGSERILFVDDEKPITKMAKYTLEQLGYKVSIGANGTEALDLFRSGPDDFDLVISDMTMPDMTGDVLATQMMAVRPNIKIILCTGYSKKISKDTAKQLGVKALLYKPLIKADFAKTVRTVLDDKKNSN